MSPGCVYIYGGFRMCAGCVCMEASVYIYMYAWEQGLADLYTLGLTQGG